MQTREERIAQLVAALEKHKRLDCILSDTITDVHEIMTRCAIASQRLRRERTTVQAEIAAVNTHLENLLSEPASEVAVPESQSP